LNNRSGYGRCGDRRWDRLMRSATATRSDAVTRGGAMTRRDPTTRDGFRQALEAFCRTARSWSRQQLWPRSKEVIDRYHYFDIYFPCLDTTYHIPVSPSAVYLSENGQYVWRTIQLHVSPRSSNCQYASDKYLPEFQDGNSPCNPSGDIAYLTRSEETPPPHTLTMLRQLLQIKELANRTAPAC
jgi:hypothetical protein